MKGREGARDKVTKRRRGKEGVEQGGDQGPLAEDGFESRDEFLVTPLLMRPVCLRSQGRFEDPVRPWRY